MTWLSIALRPLVAFALFFSAALVGRAILRKLPNGPVKRFLGRRMTTIPRTEAERKDWWPLFWIWSSIALIFWWIWFLTRMKGGRL